MTEINISEIANQVLWATFLVTFILAIVMQKSRFCTMGAITDIVVMGEWTRMRQWLMAMGVAMIGVACMSALGYIDTAKSIYTSPKINWLSGSMGGALFGFGMVLASGCGSKTLIRMGGGNLKSLVVFLTLALSAYMTIKGVFGVWRTNTVDQVFIQLGSNQDLPSLMAGWYGESKLFWQLMMGCGLGGALISFALIKKSFWTLDNLLAGVGVGLAIMMIWYISGVLGYVAEDPNTLEEVFVATNSGRMESLTYVAPYAYTIDWLMMYSDASKKLTLAIASVLGLLTGSFVYSIVTRTFRWESFRNAEDTINHLLGGVLMGVGGVTALGCTIGQGLSGVSTLALGSFIALFGFVVGTVIGMKYLNWRTLPVPCEPIVAGSTIQSSLYSGGCGMSLQVASHNEQFGTLGQIRPEDVCEIARLGYKSIINNRPDGEGGFDQPTSAEIASAAQAAGVEYAYLPVVSGQITAEQAQRMANLLETMPGPVLAFCRSGARSTNLFLLANQVK
jgi:uncharacterized protein (TIGR01244 family)